MFWLYFGLSGSRDRTFGGFEERGFDEVIDRPDVFTDIEGATERVSARFGSMLLSIVESFLE